MRRSRRATLLTAAALTLTCAVAALQRPVRALQDPAAPAQTPSDQQPPAQPAPTFRTGVQTVRVDVIVTDKSGTPVGDLKPEDFEITEAGKAQKIETFKLVSLDGGLSLTGEHRPQAIRTDAEEEIEAKRDDVRVFAIFLDDYHVKRDSAIRTREQLARWVETQLGPSDMIGVMYPLQSINGVRMTRNHDAIRRAVLQFEGRKYDYKPRNDAEARYVYRVPAEQIEYTRNLTSFAALRSLIMRLGGLKEGRKTLVVYSEGYSNSLPPQIAAYYGGLSGAVIGDTSNATEPGGGLSVPTGRQAFDAMGVTMDLQEIFDLANRNNVSIYPIDPRGLATQEFGLDMPTVDRTTDRMMLSTTMDTLKTLAENSDGRAIINRNDMTIAMKQIVVDASAYYLLGYNSNMAQPDGKFHTITVKVKRPGLEVRHRPGYWALKPEEAARLATPAKSAAPSPVESALATTATPRSRVLRTWLGNDRGANGTTRVTFVWEPMPRLAGEPVRPGQQPARVIVTATSPEGAVYFRGPVQSAAAGAAPGARVSFDAKPGPMQLRLSVEAASSEVIDSETREVLIPDLMASKTLLGTPEVFRARTIPEFQRLKGEARPVPTVARDFSRTERLLLRIPVYGPAGGTPTLTAQLVSRSGQPMMDLPIAPPDATRTVPQTEITLATLAPGDYGVAIKATSDAGEATELVAFRVTP